MLVILQVAMLIFFAGCFILLKLKIIHWQQKHITVLTIQDRTGFCFFAYKLANKFWEAGKGYFREPWIDIFGVKREMWNDMWNVIAWAVIFYNYLNRESNFSFSKNCDSVVVTQLKWPFYILPWNSSSRPQILLPTSQ